MNREVEKAIQKTLESWKSLTAEQKGTAFDDSVLRLEAWLNDLIEKRKAEQV